MTDRKTYRAKWLMTDPWTVLENGYVHTIGSRIDAVGSGKPPGDTPVIDMGSGVMIPPLVNAHTHLELSALKGKLPTGCGFLQWASELVRKRDTLPEAVLLEAASDALDGLIASGCAAIADISTLGITHALLSNTPIGGFFFHEHLGNRLPESMTVIKERSLSCSLAAHAPHTTTPVLFKEISRLTSEAGLPMSVHLSESEDELHFIRSGRGAWADFLSSRGVDFSNWPIPSESPVHYLKDLGVLSDHLLAVHLLNVTTEEIQILMDRNVSMCLCPRSNLFLHDKLPDIPRFLALGARPGLGTDSLASAPSLSILDEMAFISDNYHDIHPGEIIAMGTVYGAGALGLEDRFGRLQPGFHSPPLYIPIEADSSRTVAPAVVRFGSPGISPSSESSDKK